MPEIKNIHVESKDGTSFTTTITDLTTGKPILAKRVDMVIEVDKLNTATVVLAAPLTINAKFEAEILCELPPELETATFVIGEKRYCLSALK